MIRELHDQDAVSRHQSDQSDQPDLTIDIDGRESEEGEEEGPGESEGNRPRQNDERITEALELRGEHQIDQNRRQQEDAQKLGSFRTQLTRLAGIVDGESARQAS